jgi:hypothetical protein
MAPDMFASEACYNARLGGSHEIEANQIVGEQAIDRHFWP